MIYNEKEIPRHQVRKGRAKEKKPMRKIAAILLLIVCLAGAAVPCAGAEVERNVLLDNAFKMLEEGNIFIERYNQITGANVEVILPSGLPYFFGGKDYDRVLKNLPRYGKGVCNETTTFYRKGKTYPYGLDCQGYIYAVRSESGMVGISPLNFMYSPTYTDQKTGKRYNWEQYYIWWKYGPDKKSNRQDNRRMPEVVPNDLCYNRPDFRHHRRNSDPWLCA